MYSSRVFSIGAVGGNPNWCLRCSCMEGTSAGAFFWLFDCLGGVPALQSSHVQGGSGSVSTSAGEREGGGEEEGGGSERVEGGV